MQRKPYGPAKGRGQRGQVWQLDDGRWRARYRDADGRRVQATCERKRDAERWLRDGLEQLEAVRSGDVAARVRSRERGLTVNAAIDRFQSAHDASPARKKVIAEQLGHARRAFGTRLLTELEPYDLEAWRLQISPGYRRDVFASFKQMLSAAVGWHWIRTNPAAGVANPMRKRPPVTPFPWSAVLLVADEIDPRYAAVPVVAAGTGLRPEEWIALERSDVDLDEGVLHVRRVFSSGRLTVLGADGAKTHRQLRRVPLRRVVADALRAMPVRIDTPLLWPALQGDSRGGLYLDLPNWRRRQWTWALGAAGVPYQRPYDMRHTYAAESIAAGVNLFDLSRFMGTSLKEIDDTYGHLVADSEQRGRDALNAYDMQQGRVIGG